MKIKHALISVSDKTGIVDLCKRLARLDIKILSTGGTARLLSDNKIKITEVSDYTGFPEMMDGRLKTLHPKIHGGLLGRRGTDDAIMQKHGISAIDLVVVNLYPFELTVYEQDCSLEQAIESIDIGGPALLRAAAKNYTDVAAVTDISNYVPLIEELEQNAGVLSEKTRFGLAQKVFAHTANYDANISNYLGAFDDTGQYNDYPLTYTTQFHRKKMLRYGENPHQSAAFYTEQQIASGTIAHAEQLQGKALSYNNIADTDAALECVLSFNEPTCVIVKHANPCGVATAETIQTAYQRAYATDPTAAFGGIIAFNRALDEATARAVIEQQFVEVIIAPTIDPDALKVTGTKKAIRILCCGPRQRLLPRLEMKRVSGGLLLQEHDLKTLCPNDSTVVTKRVPTDAEYRDLLFAWRVVKKVRSNAITYCKNRQTIGIGTGQMSRIYSARIAAIKAEDEHLQVAGSVMASDAFLPFRDGIDYAADIGITAIIQPGGSIRDKEVIAAADEHDMAMIFTNMRHFLH